MQLNSIALLFLHLNLTQILSLIAVILTIILTIAKIISNYTGIWEKYKQKRHEKKERRFLRQRKGAECYTPEEIMNSRRFYIRPDCQDVDPSQEAEIRYVHAVRGDLFGNVDKLLAMPDKHKYLILLADSGMGKTSFMINYWYRHWQDEERKLKYDLALVPLGNPKADEHITKISDKPNTVIFLDAFDEDTGAIENHQKRLKKLLELCADFRQVLLTSRTQFFQRKEEIPDQTGKLITGPKGMDSAGAYTFLKLYLSPFTDEQVAEYLKRCFSRKQRKERQKAEKLVEKIPLLSVRPMILSHIQDLVQPEKDFKYTFQLYEEMITRWLDREKYFVSDTAALREFSELLAIDLFKNKSERGGERIHYDDLLPLAQQLNIPLKDWQLRGRSLLNRDVAGNYKFAHRSIMEYLFVKRILEMQPETRPSVALTDMMTKFLEELLDDHAEKKQKPPDLRFIEISQWLKYHLRSQPQKLADDDVKKILKKYDFFDSSKNKQGKGIKHRYFLSGEKEQIIEDLSTNLMWQQSGSPDSMNYEKAKAYVQKLKSQKFAGYDDWRLPTLEEAMSLMERNKNSAGLYINELFDSQQNWIWTADPSAGASGRWVVSFYGGSCHINDHYYDVRAVRFGQSPGE
jgi:hypothetical protein